MRIGRAAIAACMLSLAIVGDLHGHWSDADALWFEAAAYERIVVVGDLAGFRWAKTLAMAEALGRMRAPAVVVPGNHDASHAVQLAGEALQRPGVGRPFAGMQGRRLEAFRDALGDHELGAYSLHGLGSGPDAVTLIACRPHSMGGPSLAFAPHLAACFGVASLSDSAERLCALVDAAPTERIVFVGHNGPAGLGSSRSDIFGCDFRASEGDWGDPDLRDAVTYARSSGKRVLAVVAGHMHRRLRGGGDRTWQVERDGVLYVNAAVVPRIRRDGTHHHVHLCLDADSATATDRWVTPAAA